MASQELIRELLDLTAVHGFYAAVLESKLGFVVPRPFEPRRSAANDAVEHCLQILRRWLGLLDLSVTAPMLRDSLKAELPYESAEAILRYYVDKGSHAESDREKADCLITFLYRNPKFGAAHEYAKVLEAHDAYGAVSLVVAQFNAEVRQVLDQKNGPVLRSEHEQLLREFEFLYQELADFRTFDQLMDSGIMQRVRDLKQSFSDSFYHPDVLASVAVYNAVFGNRFDDLFRITAEQIKTFADTVQQQGASIMSRLEEGVTVKNLADVEGDQLLGQEYGRAQEQFRKVSKFKKVVDKRAPAPQRVASAPPPPTPPDSHVVNMGAHPGRLHGNPPSGTHDAAQQRHANVPGGPNHSHGGTAEPARIGVSSFERSKVATQLDNIRSFVRVADPKSCFVVPLVKGVVNITPSEAEALRADYGGEKSFRADYAQCVGFLVAMMARVEVEMHEFIDKQGSAYLWKPHADAITFLINLTGEAFQTAEQLIALAQQRGLTERVNAMRATMLRVQKLMQDAATRLQSISTQKQTS